MGSCLDQTDCHEATLSAERNPTAFTIAGIMGNFSIGENWQSGDCAQCNSPRTRLPSVATSLGPFIAASPTRKNASFLTSWEPPNAAMLMGLVTKACARTRHACDTVSELSVSM